MHTHTFTAEIEESDFSNVAWQLRDSGMTPEMLIQRFFADLSGGELCQGGDEMLYARRYLLRLTGQPVD